MIRCPLTESCFRLLALGLIVLLVSEFFVISAWRLLPFKKQDCSSCTSNNVNDIVPLLFLLYLNSRFLTANIFIFICRFLKWCEEKVRIVVILIIFFRALWMFCSYQNNRPFPLKSQFQISSSP